MSKVVSTHLWSTPLSQPLPTGYKFKGFRIHGWRTVDCLGCAISGCVVTSLESMGTLLVFSESEMGDTHTHL